MKLQYASDLHLEFPENKDFLKASPLKPEGEILVLAGDIVPLAQREKHADFFDFASSNFRQTYWVPGNHEYYHSDISEKGVYVYEKIKENVFLVNNTRIRWGNINLIFSTLWTRISQSARFGIQWRYSDFRAIKQDGGSFTIEHYNLLHDRCLSFLKEELTWKKPGKTIVITHHKPTFLNYPEELKGDPVNEAFAVELSELILSTRPNYWIFGHHHANNFDFKIGKTTLTTNQLGYVMYNEQRGFDTEKTIEV